MPMNLKSAICPLAFFLMLSCDAGGPGATGQEGTQGQQGVGGQQGPPGPPGPAGMDGRDAASGSDKSGTRLKRYASVLSADDGLKVTTPGYLYRDTSLNIDCYFQTSSDGTPRCLPSYSSGDVIVALTATTYFSDAGCSQKMYYALKPCMTPKYLLLSSTSMATCPATSQFAVYAAPSALSPTVLYSGSPGSCSSMTKSAIDSLLMSLALYDLSGKAPVSPTTFVGGTTTQMLLP